MKPSIVVIAVSLVLAAHGLARAEAPRPRTMAEARAEMNSKDWPGINIFSFGRKAETPAATASAPAAGTPARAPAPAASSAAAAKSPVERVVDKFGSKLPPPTGEPLNAAKKLDSPTQGIVVPTGR